MRFDRMTRKTTTAVGPTIINASKGMGLAPGRSRPLATIAQAAPCQRVNGMEIASQVVRRCETVNGVRDRPSQAPASVAM